MKTATHFDPADYLDDEEAIAEYLAAAFETGDIRFICSALSDVARAKGISDMATETGLSRAALYKAFGDGGNPTLSTLLTVTKAFGVKLSIEHDPDLASSAVRQKA